MIAAKNERVSVISKALICAITHSCPVGLARLLESLQSSLNMNYADLAFNELLHKNTGEARITISDHATRLYFRAAATCPDVVMRWSKLSRNYGEGLEISNKIKFWFLSFFGIRPDGKLFKLFKKWHFHLSRSS